ncbi:hypothetical protein TWF506_005339 [Arthrobotrys conoides]|uniref:Uncharacterized protein n=1 Tax=Arthrobotrys conoides TaxID=74498 RepID=A0AAN8NBN0_9PEZI
MCITQYTLRSCLRVHPDGKHVYVAFKHPHSGWDGPTCGCSQMYLVSDDDSACPLCLHKMLLLVQLQQRAQEEAPPGKAVELDYRNRPVFYDSDDPAGHMSSEEADEKRALAQERRRRHKKWLETIGVLQVGVSAPPESFEDLTDELQTLTTTQEPENTSHENATHASTDDT